MFEILIPVLILVIVIIGLMFLFNIYTKFLAKLTVKNMKKKIDSGKINDKKLIKLYNNTKKNKDNVALAIIMSGVFFKFYMRIPRAAFALYEEEMINRNLPLE